MGYMEYPPLSPLLVGYDPVRDLDKNHLVWWVERVVEEAVSPIAKPAGPGRPEYDPRLCIKVLVYGYATGVRSSRQLERLCRESLPYLALTRGMAPPSYRTLCSVRVHEREQLEQVWMTLLGSAAKEGVQRLGRIALDSTKIRADVGPESVVRQGEYDAVLAELTQILLEADETDRREDSEGGPGSTTMNAELPREHIREILRRVRGRRAASSGSDERSGPTDRLGAGVRRELSAAMRRVVGKAVETLLAAREEGRRHVSLTDPDARMMPEGCRRVLQPCHALEVAVDNGLLVAGGSMQEQTDHRGLERLVWRVLPEYSDQRLEVDADPGYYSGESVARLTRAGLDLCIPSVQTAVDMRRRLPIGTTLAKLMSREHLSYDPDADCWTCSEGNVLPFRQERQDRGQRVRVYEARELCTGCGLADTCLSTPTAKRRIVKVGCDEALLAADRARFQDPAHRRRYRRRSHEVETVFAFIRRILGIGRWMVRGADRVASEAALVMSAYQVRKVYAQVRGAS